MYAHIIIRLQSVAEGLSNALMLYIMTGREGSQLDVLGALAALPHGTCGGTQEVLVVSQLQQSGQGGQALVFPHQTPSALLLRTLRPSNTAHTYTRTVSTVV